MQNEVEQPAYEITGPDDRGLIRMKMPNTDPKHAGDYYCVTLGTDKDAIATAMRQWLAAVDHGERR